MTKIILSDAEKKEVVDRIHYEFARVVLLIDEYYDGTNDKLLNPYEDALNFLNDAQYIVALDDIPNLIAEKLRFNTYAEFGTGKITLEILKNAFNKINENERYADIKKINDDLYQKYGGKSIKEFINDACARGHMIMANEVYSMLPLEITEYIDKKLQRDVFPYIKIEEALLNELRTSEYAAKNYSEKYVPISFADDLITVSLYEPQSNEDFHKFDIQLHVDEYFYGGSQLFQFIDEVYDSGKQLYADFSFDDFKQQTLNEYPAMCRDIYNKVMDDITLEEQLWNADLQWLVDDINSRKNNRTEEEFYVNFKEDYLPNLIKTNLPKYHNNEEVFPHFAVDLARNIPFEKMDNELKLSLMNNGVLNYFADDNYEVSKDYLLTSYQLIEMGKCLEWERTHKLENKKERDTPNL